MGLLTSKHDPPDDPAGAAELADGRGRRRRSRVAADSRAPHHAESRALEFCALLAIVAVAWLTMPVAAGLLLGALMGFTLQPFYDEMYRRTGRPLLSSLTTVLGSALAIIGTVAGFGSLFVTRGVALTRSLLDALGPDGALESTVQSVTGRLSRIGLSVDYLTGKLRDAASQIAGMSAALCAGRSSGDRRRTPRAVLRAPLHASHSPELEQHGVAPRGSVAPSPAVHAGFARRVSARRACDATRHRRHGHRAGRVRDNLLLGHGGARTGIFRYCNRARVAHSRRRDAARLGPDRDLSRREWTPGEGRHGARPERAHDQAPSPTT